MSGAVGQYMMTTTVSGADGQYMLAVRLCPVLLDSTWWQYVCVRFCRTEHGGSTSVSGSVGQNMVAVRLCAVLSDIRKRITLCGEFYKKLSSFFLFT